MPNGLEKVRAEDRLRLVALRDVDEIARQQLVLVERGAIALQPALVLDPALDVVEHDLGQLALGEPVQVFDIDDVVDVHGVPPAGRRTAFSMAYFSGLRQSSGDATAMPSVPAPSAIRRSKVTGVATTRCAIAM